MNSPTASPARRRASTFRRFGWLAVAAMTTLALVGPAAGPVAAASVPPIPIAGASNVECDELDALYGSGQTWTTFKLEGGDLANGTYTVSGGYQITISNFTAPGDYGSFDWTSNFGIDAVLVKTGVAGKNLYVYDPPAESFGDTDLRTPTGQGNGFSHISFCYEGFDDPTPTPTPSVDITLWKFVCPSYEVVPANVDPTNEDATGGHGAELDDTYQTIMVNHDTDVPEECTPQAGWGFTLTAQYEGPAIATPTTGAGGSVTVTLTGADADLVKNGTWDTGVVVVEEVQAGYDFGALRCYIDILNGDNLEGIFGWNGEDPIVCIAYNIAETPEPTPTPVVTPTPTPVVTPTPTPVVTPTPTPVVTPTPTPVVTPTPTPVVTPTPTPVVTPTPTPVVTPTPTPVVTPTPTPVVTPSPDAEVLGATATPQVTPPPTATLPVSGTPGGDSWRIALLAIAGLLAMVLLLTPATPARARRRR